MTGSLQDSSSRGFQDWQNKMFLTWRVTASFYGPHPFTLSKLYEVYSEYISKFWVSFDRVCEGPLSPFQLFQQNITILGRTASLHSFCSSCILAVVYADTEKYT